MYAMKAPSKPMPPPTSTCQGSASIMRPPCAVKSQIGLIGSPERYLKTTKQISPQKMDSLRCSKYSTPKRELTSKAKRLPPRGAPKNAANAPAIPIKVCFLTTLTYFCRNSRRDTNPPSAPQIATKGASGPNEPPARMEKSDATIIGTT